MTISLEAPVASSFHVLTTEIVAAYVSSNTTAADQVPGLIADVYKTLVSLDADQAPEKDRVPAVPVKKSVYPDYIVCLEDGKKLKMLKRHLKSAYDMTPEQYRERWGLPADYPMVAPSYAAQRSRLAQEIGLGRSAAATQTGSETVTDAEPEDTQQPQRRGRPKKPSA
ncbi:MucR family transcriptional regulator [Acetobacter vaccinii]|uniref:MucR family transcriptional regulator n=1 Tax=Acetobacter vaccinii TaxID=2592655 RepID=A0A5C1YSG5_9PROT|nr:MucR family transcriptional regulator [Acetobacter vaccinii]